LGKNRKDCYNEYDQALTRSLLDQLLSDSRLYTSSGDYMELLKFVGRLRIFAPFNAMLLHVQKPGLSYAASATDWWERFGRKIKKGARPLIILWPFGPVALVYDILDTEGRRLPRDVSSFFAYGNIDEAKIDSIIQRLRNKGIECSMVDAGDRKAGSICVGKRVADKKGVTIYGMQINRNHSPSVQFATLAHELAHLFLGHLGADHQLGVPQRVSVDEAQQELEAESVSYLVCERNEIRSKSEPYLASYIKQNQTIDNVDLYQVMRAAGQVGTLLGQTTGRNTFTRFGDPPNATAIWPKFKHILLGW